MTRARSRRVCRLGITPECGDLYEKLTKAHRRWENAEYKVYTKHQYPKKESFEDAARRVTKYRQRWQTLEAEWVKLGC